MAAHAKWPKKIVRAPGPKNWLEIGRLGRWPPVARFPTGWQRHRRVPIRGHVGRGQSTLRSRLAACFLAQPVDELVECARASLGFVTESNRNLAAGHAGIGLALAEAAHVGDGCARKRYGFRRIDLCFWRFGLVAARQQYAYDAQPERHPKKKEHDATHNIPERTIRRLWTQT